MNSEILIVLLNCTQMTIQRVYYLQSIIPYLFIELSKIPK